MVTWFVCCACHLGVIVVVCFVALLNCMCVFADWKSVWQLYVRVALQTCTKNGVGAVQILLIHRSMQRSKFVTATTTCHTHAFQKSTAQYDGFIN